jgi:hypothetical protein
MCLWIAGKHGEPEYLEKALCHNGQLQELEKDLLVNVGADGAWRDQ